ncbi:aminoglycoside phosphotransferase family protein [Alkalibacillus aidingensis]|uniref:aminoglycoside phosphotransferase family protein n=1 Tax=Alkalibacillus aidingensis TaxID=2747607 RepID=UPI00166189B6|nr:aminoglycoside phosphotransferase family protein [Alkalibacillus aidingensis]
MDTTIEKIQIVKNSRSIRKIHKGFSFDEKYVVDDQYLLRLFSSENEKQRRLEFETIRDCYHYSSYVPRAIEFGDLPESEKSYMLLTYLPGEDGEEVLSDLTSDEQYQAGYKAGEELRKLNSMKAPKNLPTWYQTKKAKSDRYLKRVKDKDFDQTIMKEVEQYIKENEGLMKGRPNHLQHDDFHPNNLLIHQRRFAGIIDFQRMDWGDPFHDLHKLGYFSKPISIPFTNGCIDGYFDGQEIPELFWQLYGLYSAMHIVSAIVWGSAFERDQFKFLKARAYEVLEDHDYFELHQPKWYS